MTFGIGEIVLPEVGRVPEHCAALILRLPHEIHRLLCTEAPVDTEIRAEQHEALTKTLRAQRIAQMAHSTVHHPVEDLPEPGVLLIGRKLRALDEPRGGLDVSPIHGHPDPGVTLVANKEIHRSFGCVILGRVAARSESLPRLYQVECRVVFERPYAPSTHGDLQGLVVNGRVSRKSRLAPPNGPRLSRGALKKDSLLNLRAPPASSAC